MINFWNETWMVHWGKCVILKIRGYFHFRQSVELAGRHMFSSDKVIISNKRGFCWEKSEEHLPETNNNRSVWAVSLTQRAGESTVMEPAELSKSTRHQVCGACYPCLLLHFFLPFCQTCCYSAAWRNVCETNRHQRYVVWSWKPRWLFQRESI